MKYVGCMAAILAFSFLSLHSPSDPSKPEIIIFENAQGKVILNHADHSDMKGIKCLFCHHKYIRAKPAACSRCHPRTLFQKKETCSKILVKDALHKCCIDCHQMTSKSSSVKPPVKCHQCHQPANPPSALK